MSKKKGEKPSKNGFRIESTRVRRYDDKNIIIEVFVPGGPHPITKEVGPDHWEIYGFYGKMEDVAKALVNLLVDIPDDIRDLARAVLEVEFKVTRALKEVDHAHLSH